MKISIYPGIWRGYEYNNEKELLLYHGIVYAEGWVESLQNISPDQYQQIKKTYCQTIHVFKNKKLQEIFQKKVLSCNLGIKTLLKLQKIYPKTCQSLIACFEEGKKSQNIEEKTGFYANGVKLFQKLKPLREKINNPEVLNAIQAYFSIQEDFNHPKINLITNDSQLASRVVSA